MFFEYINERIISVAVPIFLIIVGAYFTFKLKGFFIFHPKRTIKDMLKKESRGGTSPFRALCVALAGTLGVGNIAGVGSAIMIGGAGAVFWMWVSAIFAMSLKYSEIVLAIKHRESDEGGNYGGAAYYIKSIFSSKNMKRAGSIIAAVFCALCIVNSLTMGCIMQVNSLSGAMLEVADISPALIGLAVAAICFLSVHKGLDRVGRISELAVPFASIAYILVAILAIYVARDKILLAFGKIFCEAFDLESVGGGIFGFLSSRALRAGTMRGLISNEAGCGTAPCAHASSSTTSPYKQGLLGISEVFVDTIVLCTMTALVLIISGIEPSGENPMSFCMDAFSLLLGGWSKYLVAALIFIFAYATMICWAHYGIASLRFFGRAKRREKLFLIFFCALCVFGSISGPRLAWDLADIAIGLMTLINLTVLLFAQKEVVLETNDAIGRGKFSKKC